MLDLAGRAASVATIQVVRCEDARVEPLPQSPETIPFPSGQPAQPPATIASVIATYIVNLHCRVRLGSYSVEGFANTKRDLFDFAMRYGGKPLTEAHRQDLLTWLADHPGWKSNCTRKRAIAAVRGCFSWAVDEGLIPANPFGRLRLDLPTEPRRPMTAAEYVLLMRKSSRALRRCLFFLRRTGCRTKELRELVWSQVDFANGVIVQEHHKTRRRTGRPRTFGLDAATLRFLGNLYRQRPDGREHVFLNAAGRPWASRHSLDRHFKRWATRLGLPKDVCPYALRHSFTVAGIEGGLSDRALADQLGHSTTRLVSHYGHATRGKYQHLRNVASQVSGRRPRG